VAHDVIASLPPTIQLVEILSMSGTWLGRPASGSDC
jgi:hypothetical protein